MKGECKLKRIRKVLVLVSLLLFLSVVFTGCANRDSSPQGTDELTGSKDTSSQLSGTINIVGSTSVTPLVESLGQEFSKAHEGVNIDVQGVGSTAGIKAAIDGTADIGMSSRNLKDEEKAAGVKEYIIAYDGIVIAVHPNNPVEDLDMKTIRKIFKGEITNWKEVGGENKEILVISREEGSGTRGAFEEILELQEKDGLGNTLSIIKRML